MYGQHSFTLGSILPCWSLMWFTGIVAGQATGCLRPLGELFRFIYLFIYLLIYLFICSFFAEEGTVLRVTTSKSTIQNSGLETYESEFREHKVQYPKASIVWFCGFNELMEQEYLLLHSCVFVLTYVACTCLNVLIRIRGKLARRQRPPSILWMLARSSVWLHMAFSLSQLLHCP